MRPALLCLLAVDALASPPQRNPGNHCFERVETVAFHCALPNGKWIDICADSQSSNPTFFQYRFGAAGEIELQKPDISTQNLAAWRYEAAAMARGMQRTASFTHEGHTYEVFVTEAGQDTSAGLVIQKGPEVLATLTCANQTFTDNLSGMHTHAGGVHSKVTSVLGLDHEERFLEGVRGRFGPSTDCTFAVIERGPRSEHFGVLTCGQTITRVGPLTGYAGYVLDALVPVDLNGDGLVEMAVVGQYMTGIGPEGAIPFLQWSVVTWDGQTLKNDRDLATRVEAVWTAGDPTRAAARLTSTYGAR